jgi:dimethylargininase
VEPPARGLPDACFTYDAAFVTRSGAIGMRMAKPARVDEVGLALEALERAGVATIATLAGDARADAGDLFWLDADTLAAGRGYRTNAAAHRRLAEILAIEGARLERFDLPHWTGPDAVLHLLSVVSPVSDELAVVYPRLAPVTLLEALADRGIRTLAVDDEEWASQGGNVLAVRPGVVVVASGNPRIRRSLESAGVEVHEYAATELSKGDGGPTCLTLPVLRG